MNISTLRPLSALATSTSKGIATIGSSGGAATVTEVEGLVDTGSPTIISTNGVVDYIGNPTGIASGAYYAGIITTAIIGSSVTSVGSNAFYGCTSLRAAVIGNAVTHIETTAFTYCTSLTSITIPNSVTFIGAVAFGYSGLSSIVIPDSVTDVDVSAFHTCTSLLSATIGSSITSLGAYVFTGCTSLTSINYRSPLTSIGSLSFEGSSITTIHVLSSDSTWAAGSSQTIGGQSNITVIKDLT